MNRYLTEPAKKKELAAWEETLTNLPAIGEEDAGGQGFPDRAIVSWCDQLNSLSGVCSLQSCAGHPSPGHLWLWLSERVSCEFEKRVFELACLPRIDRVERIYQPWGQEVTSIAFCGSVDGALALILSFLRELAPSSGRPEDFPPW